MLQKNEILSYLKELNDKLQEMQVKGEVCLYGGAVMCLIYDARPSTKDVDAVFKPTRQIRAAIKQIGKEHDLDEDWLNNGVKEYVVGHPQRIFLNLPSLKVFVPEPDYLLAMKTLAARVDATDKQDIQFIIKLLKIQSAEEVFSILENYYPRQRIKPATQYFVEELFEN